RAQKPKLGASVADAMQHVHASGAYVGRVRDGSPAAHAGIQVGDVVTMLANQAVQDASDVERIMARVQPRSRVPVRVLRDGRTLELILEF
ncbi:MAG: PDZ domain-containing protein, partial [Chloroflexi bacterium]|nr:PDZ domain-containing protein [Chloroflexota bacterium]